MGKLVYQNNRLHYQRGNSLHPALKKKTLKWKQCDYTVMVICSGGNFSSHEQVPIAVAPIDKLFNLRIN
ncbi:MAG: hypothetical protein DRR06_07340 [Gammaproteobacteria bacterium]|nr:MAG: hypothetical protein DRR06_07340 [Gammaproteobacteria bacterium]RLA51008.1 MAG: hypothetical protein DRR42_11505 [Gammaproteobacteria bacterium]